MSDENSVDKNLAEVYRGEKEGNFAKYLSEGFIQRHGVYSAAYGTVHCKEPLKSFEIRVGQSPGFGLPSVAILP